MDLDKTGTHPSSQERLIKHHETFYFEDDPMAIFLVENQLFKVHRHYFIQESKVFRDLFSIPQEQAEVEGMNDDRPIRLPDVTVKEFELLLKHFYVLSDNAGNVGDRSSIVSGRTQEDNLSLLSAAHRFGFERIIKLMVKELEPRKIPIIERIHLGERYGLDKWLFSAYETLLDRYDSLSLEEAAALGPERVICFIKARDFMHYEHLATARHDLANEKDCPKKLRPKTIYLAGQCPSPTSPPPYTQAVVRRFFYPLGEAT